MDTDFFRESLELNVFGCYHLTITYNMDDLMNLKGSFFCESISLFFRKINQYLNFISGKRRSSLKKVIYTCITGPYDQLISHKVISADWDYICFTDNEELLLQGHSLWRIVPLQFTSLDDARNSRWHKVFPDKILPAYDVSLYIDANIDIVSPAIFDYINKKLLYKPSKTLAIHKHLYRKCIYKEAEECFILKLDDRRVIKEHVEKLRKLNYPENNGLQENNVIYRRHHDELLKKVMEEWWWWITNGSRRDQLSFNYVIWRHKFKIHEFKKQFARDERYGIIHRHKCK